MLPSPRTSHLLHLQTEFSALLRMKSNLAAIRMERAFTRLEQLDRRYSDNQPREPNGRWASTGMRVATALLRRFPAIAVALAAYERLSQLNDDTQQAVAVFNSRDYRPSESGSLVLTQVGVLTREETQNACPGLAKVEELSRQATRDSEENSPGLRQPYRGTDIHKRLEKMIDANKSLGFQAEQSFLKSSQSDANYGTRGSVRIDVFEDVKNGTICVYDLKTGAARLDPRRGLEIATAVYNKYGAARQIIITEVRTDR